jgi:hypothetical protein
LPWGEQELEFSRAFPQRNGILEFAPVQFELLDPS